MSSLNPITFEIMRHRLWSINEEAATTLTLVSGSPVASEILDLNTSIMDSDGEPVIIGPYIAAHAICQSFITKSVIDRFSENPGISKGDMFICSDPYSGAIHQNDVTVVAPVFYEGEIIAWTGSTIHEVDVGGLRPGSQACIGADSIFQEGPPMPPIKIVEAGRLRKDLEDEYLIRSRTRELNALDLRAKIASNNVSRDRLLSLVNRYGVDSFRECLDRIVRVTDETVASRLTRIPDGMWRHISYMDYEGTIYRVPLELRKEGTRLTFDFRGAALQAPAVVNCALSGLVSGVLIAVLVHLGYKAPWSPAGALRRTKILSAEGTLIHAKWPAGVCKATTAASFMVTALSGVCMAKMINTSEELRDHVLAPWMGGNPTQELHGVDQRGEPFGATVIDAFAGGAGATAVRDGIDSGGFLRSLASAVANVETYEQRYPLIYLYRHQLTDSGGAGRFRGGASVQVMHTPHQVEEIPVNIMHTYAAEQPEAVGISGGYPGSTTRFVLRRDSDLNKIMSGGQIPTDLEDLQGRLEVIPGVAVSNLRVGDVYTCTTSGGAGYGDPLERDPESVREDVVHRIVSSEVATRIYGVILTGGHPPAVDIERTRHRRERIRAERLDGRPLPPTQRTGKKIQRLTDYISVIELPSGELALQCSCGALLGSPDENYKQHCAIRQLDLREAGPMVNPYRIGGDRFVFRQIVCPSCATLLETEIVERDEALVWDVQIDLERLRTGGDEGPASEVSVE